MHLFVLVYQPLDGDVVVYGPPSSDRHILELAAVNLAQDTSTGVYRVVELRAWPG